MLFGNGFGFWKTRPIRRRSETGSVSGRGSHWGVGPVVTTVPDARTDDTTTATLSIPDYDELSASQVVQRLPGLSHDELEAIRAYETHGRGRRTILGKIDQLAR